LSDLQNKPLNGIGILVTRAEDQAAGMIDQLENLGATVYPFPVIVIKSIPQPAGLKTVLDNLISYDRLMFTSVNGVKIFADHLGRAGISPSGTPAAICVGPRTAEAWETSGGRVSETPQRFSGEGIVDLLDNDLTGRSYLILRPEVVKADLGASLSSRGARVDEVILYRTEPNRGNSSKLNCLLGNGAISVITFTSPSSVKGLVEIIGEVEPVGAAVSLCIGPTTARAAREAGLKRVFHPDEFTVEGMLQMIPALVEGGVERRKK